MRVEGGHLVEMGGGHSEAQRSWLVHWEARLEGGGHLETQRSRGGHSEAVLDGGGRSEAAVVQGEGHWT